MKSPCLHRYGLGIPCEFIDEDKKCDRCVNCPDRIKYFNSTAFPPSMPDKPRSYKIMTEEADKKLSKYEDLIASMCKETGITVEQLRGRTTHKISETRRVIALALKSKDYGLNNREIGEYLGVNSKIIQYLLNKKVKDKPEEKPEDPQDKIKVAMASLAHKEIIGHADLDNYHIIYNPHAENPDDEIKVIPKHVCITPGRTISIDSQSIEIPNSGDYKIVDVLDDFPDNQYRITIDFSNHQDVFDDLVVVAERQLRDPAMQALFVLRYVYEKGLKISELISTV